MENTFNEILEKHKKGEGNIISLLQEIQEAFGYVPREAVYWFSKKLDIPGSRIFGVATFYSQFRLKPVGKHRITACCGTACHVRGAEKIITGITRELQLPEGEDTTPDREFTFEKIACLGTCSFAPVVLVEGNVRGKAKLDSVLKELKALKGK